MSKEEVRKKAREIQELIQICREQAQELGGRISRELERIEELAKEIEELEEAPYS